MKRAVLGLLFAVFASPQENRVEGNSASSVRVVAYEDLQCPDCATYRKMMDESLLPKYRNQVAFEHREFPLPKHKWARPAAVAALYFSDVKPELGVEFRRYCAANFKAISPENIEAKIAEFAKANGADPSKAVAALKDSKYTKQVEEEYQEGVARGVARTPTVFVNGEPFIETFTVEEISKGIDTALAAGKQ